MSFARNVEVWIFGAFGALVLAACLDGKDERPLSASRTGVAPEVVAQPQAAAAQQMYVVYVVGKRPSAAEKKRALRAGPG